MFPSQVARKFPNTNDSEFFITLLYSVSDCKSPSCEKLLSLLGLLPSLADFVIALILRPTDSKCEWRPSSNPSTLKYVCDCALVC